MTSSTNSEKTPSSYIKNLSVGMKLGIGFSTILAILVIVIVSINFEIKSLGELQNRVAELRFPTNTAGQKLVTGLNRSLAALRGYMILDNDKFIEERQAAWQDIDHNLNTMKQLSQNWTESKNIEKLRELRQIMSEFKLAQQQVEDISNSIDEQPAMKILLTEAAPLAEKIIQSISAMIDEEKTLPADVERKALLGLFADSRGSFAMGLASIRGFLISGDQKWADDFNRRWAINTERLDSILADRELLTDTQKQYFESYLTSRQTFSKLPKRMIEIRGSNKWNMANYLLGTEAAPLAVRANEILTNMVENQKQLVAADVLGLHNQISFIKISSFFAAVIALIIGGVISWRVTKSITAPLKEVELAANMIAKGDLSGDINVTSKDEVGKLQLAMKMMQMRLSEVIENDIQSIVDAAREGDLTQRINLDGKEGFYETLSLGVNDVVRSGDTVVRDMRRVLSALAEGDLNETITREYKGSYNELKVNINKTISKIKSVIEVDIQEIVNSARSGDLQRQIELEDKKGFFLNLSQGINELITTVGNTYEEINNVMSNVASGDLTKKVEKDYSGIYGEVKDNINATVDRLGCVLAQIGHSSETVVNAATKITSDSTVLAKRTEQQASNLEQTAAAMEQITSTVENNADNSKQASQIADSTEEKATKGGSVVNEAIGAMDAITESSKKITEIIGVIDDIAFQTNLLALNASVEAARAGEQGRGFAVVATEVRNLAQRSATAASEIKELITESGSKVDRGVALVNQSGENLAKIVEGVKDVGVIISQIATASNEQFIGIKELNKSIIHLDETTRSNANLSEDVYVSSVTSKDQASLMGELIQFFTVTQRAKEGACQPPSKHESEDPGLKLVQSMPNSTKGVEKEVHEVEEEREAS